MLREYAELDKRIVLAGQGNKFEIWDESRWNTARSGWTQQDPDDLSDELEAISL